MPPPYPDPVQFDHALAAEAIATLRAAAGQLRSLMGDDVQNGSRALANWKGPHADHFRTDFGTMQTGAQQLIGDLLTWAQSIDDASTAAAELQGKHDAANQQWRQDHPTAPHGRRAE